MKSGILYLDYLDTRRRKKGGEINAIETLKIFFPELPTIFYIYIYSTLDSSFKLIIHLEHLLFNS